MEAHLATTNLLLGIMAAASLLEALLLAGAGVTAFVLYRRVTMLVDTVEARHIAPVMLRVNAILDDAKSVSATVRQETDRVDHAIRSTMDRVDDTAERVRSNVRAKTSWVVGAIRGLRVAIETALHTDGQAQPHERVM